MTFSGGVPDASSGSMLAFGFLGWASLSNSVLPLYWTGPLPKIWLPQESSALTRGNSNVRAQRAHCDTHGNSAL